MLAKRCFFLFTLLFFCTFVNVAESYALPRIMGTFIDQKPMQDLLIFELNQPAKHQKVFILKQPDRLVIDMERLDSPSIFMPSGYTGKTIRNVRAGQFDLDTTRIVVDLHHPVKKASVHHFTANKNHPYRMIVELNATNNAGTPITNYPTPAPKPSHVAREASKPLIMIDAGHGGKDPGAIGKKGTREKKVTLHFARILRKALLKTGSYRVALTRDKDQFISLRGRVELARKAEADIFISIHADAAPSSSTARGLSIYTLSETASDAEAAALAAQENKADIIGGLDLAEEHVEVADILIDLAQRETKNKSSDFADTMVRAMKDSRIRVLKNPHRFAGFRVLKAPDIPSVLIELGFLTNSKDERLIDTKEFQDNFTRGVVVALDRYFEK